MKLCDQININTNYTRSINLERDANSPTIARSYITTSRTLLTLTRISETFVTEDNPRAFALIGPYGSGKSAFAIFLSYLLGPPSNNDTKITKQILKKADPFLHTKFSEHTKDKQGYLPVLITGTPEPLAHRFITSLYESAKKYWGKKRGPKHQVIKKLEQATQKNISIKEIISLVSELQQAIATTKSGILIIFDELGKFLEYEARHEGDNDIYLLQALAEQAYKGGAANLIVTVIMHQGFEQYARGLGEKLREEWSKVQGRFETIPFLESTEQTLHILANAFEYKFNITQEAIIHKKCTAFAVILEKQNALPGVLKHKEAAYLFTRCYPLHPIASLVLPILCQKIAQNERTLFSYLGSSEPHGFKESLEKITEIGEFVSPWEIYEYFILNQPAVFNDPVTHRRWAEVVTAVERLGDAPDEEVQLVKTIGLLNIIGTHGGLKASKAIIELCITNKQLFNKTLTSLINKSIIHFRKFSNEYRIWQGSDFDLESAVQEELNQIGYFNLPEALNDRKSLSPIVARRHAIKTGALRYFEPYFVDRASYIKEKIQSSSQRIIFFLAETHEDRLFFLEQIISHFSDQDIIVLWQHSAQLRKTTAEVVALQRVQSNRPELHSDPVAMREYKDRLTAAEMAEDELLSALLETPQNGEWFWRQKKLDINNKRVLQERLSKILDKIYYKAPIFKNELINREKPSTQAIAARNKLILALLHNADKPDLGIEKYPAEKGIYLTFLKASNLHREINGVWQLSPPLQQNDPSRINPTWEKINSFLEKTEYSPQSFEDLSKELQAPPYGIKSGVLPLLYVTVFLTYQYELGLYENNAYVPHITEQHIERFVKRPEYFKIRRFRIKGMRSSIFKQYVQALYNDDGHEKNLLSIIKPLAKFIDDLPEYTKNTKSLSPLAQSVCQSFELAKSPEEFLFSALPKACGFPEIDPDKDDEKSLEGFSTILMDALRELKYAYPNLLNEQKNLLTYALLPQEKAELSIATLRKKLSGRFDGLTQYTVDVKGLKPFLQFICTNDGDDILWLENLLMFLAGKPASKWLDIDRDSVDLKLAEFSRRLIDLRKLQIRYDSEKTKKQTDFDIILLRTLRLGKTENEDIICIDNKQKEKISKIEKKINDIINEFGAEYKALILADLVDKHLNNKDINVSNDSDQAEVREVSNE